MSILRWILADIESMLPTLGFAAKVRSPPEVGDEVPTSPLPLPRAQQTILLFTRVSAHGCDAQRP